MMSRYSAQELEWIEAQDDERIKRLEASHRIPRIRAELESATRDLCAIGAEDGWIRQFCQIQVRIRRLMRELDEARKAAVDLADVRVV